MNWAARMSRWRTHSVTRFTTAPASRRGGQGRGRVRAPTRGPAPEWGRGSSARLSGQRHPVPPADVTGRRRGSAQRVQGLNEGLVDQLTQRVQGLNEGLVDQLAQLGADGVRGRRDELGEEAHRELLRGVDPEGGGRRAAPGQFARRADVLAGGRVADEREAEAAAGAEL